MDYRHHKNHFNTAYATGSDIWTHLAIPQKGGKLIEKLPIGSRILDIGSGRGIFAKQLAEAGFQVVGIDFEESIVEKANREVQHWGLEKNLKFQVANALELPFDDASFDGVCAFGLLENLHQEDWEKYREEVNRVLKPGGFYLNMSFSRKTINFLNFSPINSPDGEFEKHGVHYHFFEEAEMANIFNKKFRTISQEVKFIKEKTEPALLESFFEKSR